MSGIVMLTAGGRLYWLFLGVIGFIFGFDLAEMVMHAQPHDTMVVVALLAGLAGALLTIFLQKIAIAAGGVFAGGYLAIRLMESYGVRSGLSYWLLLALGCIIGTVFMKLLFNWALIILSSGIGSVLILEGLNVSQQMKGPLFIVLLIVGVAVQSLPFGRKSPADKRRPD